MYFCTMRNSFSFSIKDKKGFAKKLFFWTKRFKYSCFLDSNISQQNSPISYRNYDFISAVGTKKKCSPKSNNFQELERFFDVNKDWIFGYFSYDLKNEINGLRSNNLDYLEFPKLFFFIPKIVFLIQGNNLKVESTLSKQGIEKILSQINLTKETTSDIEELNLQKRESKNQYIKKIEKIKAHIKRGDIYELNYCQEFFSKKTKIKPHLLFWKLNKKAKAPFSSFFQFKKKYLICTSPERFLRKKNQQLISQPIKGTRKRSSDIVFDLQLKEELINSEKDKSENVMITDLVRNDLSKFSKKASVKVEDLFGVYTFEQVHQMITTISAEIEDRISIFDVIRGAFPMGSMTGAPKRKAMELIEKYETTKRGLFSGSVGYIKPNFDFDFNVVIRSLLYNSNNDYCSVMAGGAITNKSIAEEEYEECFVKIKAILEIAKEKTKDICESKI